MGISKSMWLSLFFSGLLFLFAGRKVANAFVGDSQIPLRRANAAFLPGLGKTTRQTITPTTIFSDIPRMDGDEEETDGILYSITKFLPPPPEDQFIMTGDIAVLAFYAFTSHVVNNWVVQSTLQNSLTIQDAFKNISYFNHEVFRNI